MGLVLNDPKGGELSPPSDVFLSQDDDASLPLDQRHLPPSRDQLRNWRLGPSKARLSPARQAVWAVRYWYDFFYDQARETSEAELLRHSPLLWPRHLKPHQVELLLKTRHAQHGRWYSERILERAERRRRRGARVRGQRRWARDVAANQLDCDDLAVESESQSLPAQDCSRSRRAQPAAATDAGPTTATTPPRRPPSLERQGAFRAASTAKTLRQAASPSPAPTVADASVASLGLDAEDDTELYRLGILYDNEHERGSGFDLDRIEHDEPVYAIYIDTRRQRQQQQRRRRRRPSRASDQEQPVEDESREAGPASSLPTLPLALSFANLADDAALARFLVPEQEPAKEPAAAYPSAVRQPQPMVTVVCEQAPAGPVEDVGDAFSADEADADVASDSDAGVADAAPENEDWVVDMLDAPESAESVDDDEDFEYDGIDFDIDDNDGGDDATTNCIPTNKNSSPVLHAGGGNPDETWLVLRSSAR